jgi:hypothetical protein
MRPFGLILFALTLSACPDTSGSGPAKVCIEAEEKCLMPSGVLGVCNVVDCRADQVEPCLVCRSQH